MAEATLHRLEIRETALAADGSEIAGIAVPWDQQIEIYPGMREQVAAGAVDPAAVVGIPLLWRHSEPIGRVTAARSDETGLHISARISDTSLGRDALTLVADDAVSGLSIGFVSSERDVREAGDERLITHTAIEIRELSVTPLPAYPAARITGMREESLPQRESTAMLDDSPLDARLDALSVRIDAIAERSDAQHAHAPERLGAWFREARTDPEQAALLTRAWTSQLTGNNAGVILPNYLREIVGIVDHGRPAIAALGVQPVESGMSVSWPTYSGAAGNLVGLQATEKTEIRSVRVDISQATASLTTFAGGGDISYQLLNQSDPSYLEAFLRIALRDYAATTDTAFCVALVAAAGAAATYTKGSPKDFYGTAITASIAVAQATGSPASVVLVGATLYAKLLSALDTTGRPLYATNGDSANAQGIAGMGGLAASVAGIPLVLDPFMDPDTAIVANGMSARWLESGPQVLSADVPKLVGRDVAVWGLGAAGVFSAAGIKAIKEAP
jgi:HK97 family phage prohead protease